MRLTPLSVQKFFGESTLNRFLLDPSFLCTVLTFGPFTLVNPNTATALFIEYIYSKFKSKFVLDFTSTNLYNSET